jgi:hypothetical protein
MNLQVYGLMITLSEEETETIDLLKEIKKLSTSKLMDVMSLKPSKKTMKTLVLLD